MLFTNSHVEKAVVSLMPDVWHQISREPMTASLVEVLARHSLWTFEHSLRVCYIAQALVDAPADKILLGKAGFLHDIGKDLVPPEILDSPGPLSEEGKNRMKWHPLLGYLFVKQFDVDAAEIIIGHHEFQKYPYYRQSSRGNLIEFMQMRLALADQIDASRSDRPYSPSEPEEQTRAFLKGRFPDRLSDRGLLAFDELATRTAEIRVRDSAVFAQKVA